MLSSLIIMEAIVMKNKFEFEKVSIRLVKEPPIMSPIPITSPEEAIDLVGKEIREMDREVVAVINLKQDGIPINFNIASIGAVNYSVACPRELLKTSILSNAASMIILHNHPSGSLKASKDDILMTNKMEKICEQIGIPLRDHIIVAPGRVDYFSFRKENMIGSNLIQTIADGKEKAR